MYVRSVFRIFENVHSEMFKYSPNKNSTHKLMTSPSFGTSRSLGSQAKQRLQSNGSPSPPQDAH